MSSLDLRAPVVIDVGSGTTKLGVSLPCCSLLANCSSCRSVYADMITPCSKTLENTFPSCLRTFSVCTPHRNGGINYAAPITLDSLVSLETRDVLIVLAVL